MELIFEEEMEFAGLYRDNKGNVLSSDELMFLTPVERFNQGIHVFDGA